MMIVGRLVGRIDIRLIIASGFLITAFSVWQMMQFDTLMDARPVFWSGITQGLGTGIAYVPMAAAAFATLPGDLRNDGSAMFSLTRNIGSSIGISAVQALLIRNTQIMHASLAEHISPYNLANRDPHIASQLLSPQGTAAVNAALTQQASMIAYLDDFKLMLILTLLALPLVLFIKPPRSVKDTLHVAAE
jgi:DHA2 family multidrug resistance protein